MIGGTRDLVVTQFETPAVSAGGICRRVSFVLHGHGRHLVVKIRKRLARNGTHVDFLAEQHGDRRVAGVRVLIRSSAFEWSDAAFEFRPKQARFRSNCLDTSFQMAEPPLDPLEAGRYLRIQGAYIAASCCDLRLEAAYIATICSDLSCDEIE